jgi:hypothetical protein
VSGPDELIGAGYCGHGVESVLMFVFIFIEVGSDPRANGEDALVGPSLTEEIPIYLVDGLGFNMPSSNTR